MPRMPRFAGTAVKTGWLLFSQQHAPDDESAQQEPALWLYGPVFEAGHMKICEMVLTTMTCAPLTLMFSPPMRPTSTLLPPTSDSGGVVM